MTQYRVPSRSFNNKDLDRLFNKIIFNGSWFTCWGWNAYIDPDGYARFRFDGHAHCVFRLIYEKFVCKIEPELHLDHLCRNNWCVNPLHMEPVTMRENLMRSPTYNANKTHCPKNHEYTEENTYHYPNGRRECRICSRANKRNYKLKMLGVGG